MKTGTMTRFDTRISTEQKELFEMAAKLGGYRTLSEFVISSAKRQAEVIVEKHNAVLASEKDRTVFFAALMNPPSPNNQLKKAADRYKKMASKK